MQEISIKKLYLIVFSTGAVVMILELIGSRILAPALGTSIFIWTSLLGIILGAMSLGYFLGGKLADQNPNVKFFSLIIFTSGVLMFFIIIIKTSVLEFSVLLGMKNGAIFSAITLFALPAVLLGAVSPYAARMAIKEVESSGRTMGNLYAVSTFGSIIGTFLAGFYLIPNFGSTSTLYALAFLLLFISIFSYYDRIRTIGMLASFLFLFGFSLIVSAIEKEEFIANEDSAYNRIRIYDREDENGGITRIMAVENFFDSGMFLGSEELAFDYTRYYRLDEIFKKNIKKTALFGGAAYSVPKDFLRRNKEGTIDVIEIDLRTTELAEKYFHLDTTDKRLHIYHEDARIFLNRTEREGKNKYDVIYNDAFTSTCSIPFHLTTKESIEKIYNILGDDGVYIMNSVSAISGENSKFFRAEYKTIKEKFENVFVFPVLSMEKSLLEDVQNIMIIATKKRVDIDEILENNKEKETGELLKHYYKYEIKTDDIEILTDDFAPVDHYTSDFCIF
ncbi:MAG: fused MFS/spermidine synthase [Candidatus Pacebacteria bacterium]|nr:fused MFS/spermidine synthase [Candidatus Paceibacterota bacterium]